MATDPLSFRKAQADDLPAIASLIRLVTDTVSSRDYTPEQIEAAHGWVFGADASIIADGTYFVAYDGERLAGCGGWSRRRRPFGGDASGPQENDYLDPATDRGNIRAFFVSPDHLRRGIARELLRLSEADALATGFERLTTTATLSGEAFYLQAGYRIIEKRLLEKEGYAPFPAFLMHKELAA
jgi:N-acetylglutamate synthase-like GNAT family acetyltransferase